MSDSKKYHQYFSTRPILNIITTLGKKIRFVAGVYITDNEHEIEFLDKEIKQGHPMIYVKKGDEVVGAEALDPMAAIKAKIIAEHEAAKAAQADPKRDMGNTSTPKGAGLQTTAGIANITVGSTVKK